MNFRAHPYVTFLALGAITYVCVETAAEFAARIIVDAGTPGNLWGQVFAAVFSGIGGTAILAAPFVLLGWICGSLAKKTDFKNAGILFFVGACALAMLAYMGTHASQENMKAHAWTGAALSYLFLPFYGIPVLLGCLVIRLLAGRKKNDLAAKGQ